MKQKKILSLAVGGLLALAAQQAGAASIILEGDYIRTAFSDDGTLGFGGGTAPGLLHDATGTGDFGSTRDYLTPGIPWEVFSIYTDQTGLLRNMNSSGDSITGVLSDTSGASGYDQSVNWMATFSDIFSVSTDAFFNSGDERISFLTTITAIGSLSSVKFLRAIDPDPDNYPGGTANTTNGRGFGSLLPSDWVHSEGGISGLTLGLFSDSSVTHNTGVTNWTVDPQPYLDGMDLGDGDNTIGIAFDIGSLTAGDSVSFDYHYVMGDSLETSDIPGEPEPPGPPPASEPGTLLLMAMGLMGLVYRRRQKK